MKISRKLKAGVVFLGLISSIIFGVFIVAAEDTATLVSINPDTQSVFVGEKLRSGRPDRLSLKPDGAL